MKNTFSKYAVIALALLTGAARDTVAAESIALQTRVVEQVEMGQVTWYDVRSKLGKFSLIPPANWRPQAGEAQGTLCFQSPDRLSLIEIKFCPGAMASAGTNRAEAARQMLQRSYPGAVIVEEFPSFTSLAPAHTCDAHWKGAKGGEMAIRLAMVPCPGGAIEFHLYARPEAIQQSYPVLGSLMVSFGQTPSENDSQPARLSSAVEKMP